MRILLAEDDAAISTVVARALALDGHPVDIVDNGVDALWMAGEFEYDAVLLDVNMPAPDGLEVCRQLRARSNWVPILLITGAATVEDRVRGLDAGADDFIPKPFAPDELMARVRANTRRAPVARPSTISAADVEVDLAARRATRDGEELPLSPKELGLLELFVRNAGVVMTRSFIESRLWDFAFEPQSNVVDSLVRRLRDKLDRPGGAPLIETLRGEGYRFAAA